VLELRTCAALLFIVLAPPVALAQAPWIVKVTPLMNPLPVGYCAAVQLSVLDASGKEPPRNPQGQRVTMADFDMTVDSPTASSVVGQQIDAYHWSVCGCQGTAPGTAATITASYPARSLSAAARVPGVDVRTSARFELAAPKGDVNPKGCQTPVSTAAVAAATRASQTPRTAVAVPPVLPPITVTPTPPPPSPISVGAALPEGAGATRVAPYVPGPVTVTFDLSANGSWYEPGPVTVTFDMSAHGSWYEPGPVTVTFDMSAHGSWYEPGPVTVTFDVTATGSWNERAQSPGRPIQPTPLGR
jgi:hypothetical protein